MEETLKYYQYSPLALAYIGDSVFDLKIKSYVVEKVNMQSEKYHNIVTAVVSARSQAGFIDAFYDKFTETEQDIYRRARNASVHSKAKNASMAEYKKATGFEAVLGYLYLIKDDVRLDEIVSEVIEYAGI